MFIDMSASHIKVEFKGKSWVPKLVLKKIILSKKSSFLWNVVPRPNFHQVLRFQLKYKSVSWTTSQIKQFSAIYKSSLGAQLLPEHTLLYIKVFKLRIFKPGKKISMVLPSSPVKISGKLWWGSWVMIGKQTTYTQTEIIAKCKFFVKIKLKKSIHKTTTSYMVQKQNLGKIKS